MSYDLFTNQRSQYVELHRRELEAAVAEARLARLVRKPGRMRRLLGVALIAAGEALVCQSRTAQRASGDPILMRRDV